MKTPVFSRSYRIFAYKTCKRLGILLTPLFKNQIKTIEDKLRKAELYMTGEEYLATIFFTMIVITPFIFAILYIIFSFVYELGFLLAFLISIIFSLIGAAGMLVGFYVYPSYKVDKIKRDIELNIPYSTTHMATIAGTGVPIYVVFKLLGEFGEYGEIAKQCKRISRNIEIFGYDTITALSEVAANTPSPSLKDLLWGMVSIIRTGGDLRRFLMEKAESFMEHQKNLEAEYVENLGLMAELYTTIFVAGPVLFVVMVTIMGSLGHLPLPLDIIFGLAIYIILPVLALAFIVMIEGSKPVGAL